MRGGQYLGAPGLKPSTTVPRSPINCQTSVQHQWPVKPVHWHFFLQLPKENKAPTETDNASIQTKDKLGPPHYPGGDRVQEKKLGYI